MRLTAVLFLLFIFLYLAPYTLNPAFAQNTSIEVTSVYQITDKDAIEGDILISSDKGLFRAGRSYDNRLFGILQLKPLVVFRTGDPADKPVVRSGTANVNVTLLNGPIKYGDYITSSAISGKGQKATESGYVIGIALGSFDGKEASQIDGPKGKIASGTIQAAVNIEYAELTNPRFVNRLFSFIAGAFMENIVDPKNLGLIARYVAAGLVVVLGFTFAFLTFSGAIVKSIDALGRNPLARNAIQMAMIINIILLVIIVTVAVVASVLLIKL